MNVNAQRHTQGLPVAEEKPIMICAFALHRGHYCQGDTQQPATHHPKCPYYRPSK